MADKKVMGYRKNTSSDGIRSPKISESVSKRIDIIAKYKGINFTQACEEALNKYVSDYINELDFVEQQELLKILWEQV